MNKKPVLLIILDGFGYRQQNENNAIALANMPHFKQWLFEYPSTLLKASGIAVGLPEGSMGNSQVGHLTIGAGRIIKQPLSIINESLENGSFFSNQKLLEPLQQLKYSNNTLHIMGLLSDAGVHSSIEHLFAFVKVALEQKIQKIIIHPFLDGRDAPPQSASKYLTQLQEFIENKPSVEIGTIHGRFWAMDRDNNWDRTKKSYEVLTKPNEIQYSSWQDLLSNCYKQGITDEFVPPTQIKQENYIKPNDGIIFFNYRPDRARQLTECFINPDIAHIKNKLPFSFFITPVSYGHALHTTILFKQPIIDGTMKEHISKKGKTIFSIAETEKYAHVTYFFDGGKEKTFLNERRILVPSIKIKNYIDNPCMSAPEITKHIIDSLQANPADFYLINYANADMVGHSGNLAATIKAVECLDKQLYQLYQQVIERMDGIMFITADHGKAEDMGRDVPKTAHTTNPVPFVMIKRELKNKQINLPLHGLSDIARFILQHI